MQKVLPPIAITTGDHRGIGPEVIAKGLHQLRNKGALEQAVVFGLPELYKPFQKFLPKTWRVFSEDQIDDCLRAKREQGALSFLVPNVPKRLQTKKEAFLCGRYIELATELAREQRVSAVVTGPIDKTELHRGGYHFDGHTEMLQKICGSKSVTMMMAGPQMRISLVTTHVSIRNLPKKLTAASLHTCLTNTHAGLRDFFGIRKPKIAVLGLNPHASDNGLFGDEEKKLISPAIGKFNQRLGASVAEGPFPPDGFFALWKTRYSKRFDAVVCMYHDQGLIPVKLYDFDRTVNLSLGLPIVRTSVDHGIGLDIVGRNSANPSSFIAAFRMAQELTQKRK